MPNPVANDGVDGVPKAGLDDGVPNAGADDGVPKVEDGVPNVGVAAGVPKGDDCAGAPNIVAEHGGECGRRPKIKVFILPPIFF